MNYIVLDFETANSSRTSAYALGMAEVTNGEITKTWDYLFDPEEPFDYFNMKLHGVTPDIVNGKPIFIEVWSELKEIISDKIVIAHNASFDISVLRHVLDKYNLEYPSFKYSCTRILSKKTWADLVNYRLDTVAANLNIEFKHHQECEDAIATAKIFNEILKLNETDDFEELHNKLQVKIGSIYPGGYTPAEVKKIYKYKPHSSYEYIKASDIVPETTEFDESHELFGKGICFTGTLTSMSRKDAAQSSVNKGAIYCSSVTKKTNFLVMGVQDYSKFVDGQKSSKLKKAEELIKKGQDLEIIGEDEFLKLL